jgi:succinate dehydrogenase/fumarate reductase cytochrome b subunit
LTADGRADILYLMRYRLQTGSFAWVIHRVSAVVLALYLFIHIPGTDISIKSPLVNVIVFGLLLCHALNGLRLALLDIGVPTGFQKYLFYLAAMVAAVLFILGAGPVLRMTWAA